MKKEGKFIGLLVICWVLAMFLPFVEVETDDIISQMEEVLQNTVSFHQGAVYSEKIYRMIEEVRFSYFSEATAGEALVITLLIYSSSCFFFLMLGILWEKLKSLWRNWLNKEILLQLRGWKRWGRKNKTTIRKVFQVVLTIALFGSFLTAVATFLIAYPAREPYEFIIFFFSISLSLFFVLGMGKVIVSMVKR